MPAEDLAEFNGHLEGPIQVTAAFFGAGFTGEVPTQGALKGKKASEQLVALAGMLAAPDIVDKVATNHQAVFLNFFFWEHPAAEGIGADERDRVLELLRESWARSGRAGVPLGVTAPGGG